MLKKMLSIDVMIVNLYITDGYLPMIMIKIY